VAARHLGSEDQEPLAHRRVHFVDERRAALEVEPGIRPAGLGKLDREGDERYPVVIIELREDSGRGRHAGGGQLIAVA
jgi:hypothetical protein